MFLFLSRRLRQRAKREKEVFRGLPHPGKGRLPFAIPLKNRYGDAKVGIPTPPSGRERLKRAPQAIPR